ncbi:MAG: PDZ domain-containing protein [Lysobacteraceae bacterium]|nr:MAG: PDZ domain-containing protein [Xanthomonadaceae bacterium]
MMLLRSTLLALSIAACVSLAVVAADGPTPAQQKEIDAAREDLARAGKRLAELHRKYGVSKTAQWNQRLASRPLIGVVLAPDPQNGVRIAGVTPDGAAAAAGLKTGDRLISIDGKPIVGDSGEARVESARAALGALDANKAVKLGYLRDGHNAEASVTPKTGQHVMVFAGDGQFMQPGGNVVIRRIDGVGDRNVDLDIDIDGGPDAMVFAGEPGMHGFAFSTGGEGGDAGKQEVQTRVIRLGCKDGKDCKPGQIRLAEAFRWNGLNLASVDSQLGRYFGANEGVLVLSTSPLMPELQPGDVIRKIDGNTVTTPRAVMDTLRGKPADSMVRVEYLRDRASGSAQIKVPKAMPPHPPMPLHPPVPPLPPKAGAAGAGHAHGAPVVISKRKIVMIDDNGQVQTWEDDGEGPMPPPPPTPPAPPQPPQLD